MEYKNKRGVNIGLYYLKQKRDTVKYSKKTEEMQICTPTEGEGQDFT